MALPSMTTRTGWGPTKRKIFACLRSTATKGRSQSMRQRRATVAPGEVLRARSTGSVTVARTTAPTNAVAQTQRRWIQASTGTSFRKVTAAGFGAELCQWP